MAAPPPKRQKREQPKEDSLPQKKHYRQRAHANVFSDHDLVYPISPAHMDWSSHYPAFTAEGSPEALAPPMLKGVTIADIGCGFGGLLFALAPKFADKLILGLEIRTSVSQYVIDKIKVLRAKNAKTAPNGEANEHDESVPGGYQNISCLRANSMKFMPNFFPKASLTHIFLCFPDPHFKTKKHKARIVSSQLNSEYAYVLAPGGRVYTITDVEDLHVWMVKHLEAHPSFKRVPDEVTAQDEVVALMKTQTEESQKVIRNGGNQYVAVYERLPDPEWPEERDSETAGSGNVS